MPPPHAQTLRIHGPDALEFTHAVFSSDMLELEVGRWQWSAWLDPQGRMRFLFQALREAPSAIVLLLRGGNAEEMASALRPFVLRKQVDIDPQPARALLDAPASPDRHFHVDGEEIWLGMGNYGMRITPVDANAASAHPMQAWRRAAILAGHPWLPQAAAGKILASSLPLQQLGGVSMDKGCFPGQEIVARLHFRGGCKRHMQRIQAPVPLEPGTPLAQSGRAVGMVLDSVPSPGGCDALAVLNDAVTSPEAMLEIGGSSHMIHVSNVA